VQCSAVQCSAVQCSTVQCSAVQCSARQRNIPAIPTRRSPINRRIGGDCGSELQPSYSTGIIPLTARIILLPVLTWHIILDKPNINRAAITFKFHMRSPPSSERNTHTSQNPSTQITKPGDFRRREEQSNTDNGFLVFRCPALCTLHSALYEEGVAKCCAESQAILRSVLRPSAA
jgi:hypothetical protein